MPRHSVCRDDQSDAWVFAARGVHAAEGRFGWFGEPPIESEAPHFTDAAATVEAG